MKLEQTIFDPYGYYGDTMPQKEAEEALSRCKNYAKEWVPCGSLGINFLGKA